VYQAPRGTQDILPEDIPYHLYVEETARRVAALYGYQEARTPTFEDSGLFRKGTGETTDIVEKEMYSFVDKGNSDVTLRPEATPSMMRLYMQHGLHARPQPQRLYQLVSCFRYDRPQAGRQREFHQFDIEAIGEEDAAVDAELITLFWRFCEALGLSGLSLELNSIGDPVCRPQYLEALRQHYAAHEADLCGDCRRRLTLNPLRLLDCKVPTCQPIADAAPAFTDHLCDDCHTHFDQLLAALEREGITPTLNRRLVRGLDYYTRTVFELYPPKTGQQSALGGGGRYDGLAEVLGGRHTPAVGFASGIERLVINLKDQGIAVPQASSIDVFVSHVGDSQAAVAAASELARDLRSRGFSVLRAVGQRSIRARLRHADSAGVRWAALIGDEEVQNGTVSLRDMSEREPVTVSLSEAVERISHGTERKTLSPAPQGISS
jgi:histidyl-tRNA synthetase